MNLQYLNQQDDSDPMNGSVIVKSADLMELLDSKRNEAPFVAELRGDNGFMLVFGIGGGIGCVEHRRTDGDLPYLMAVSQHPPIESGDIEFLCGGTPTPIPGRNILSFAELKQIATRFLETGERSDLVSWELV
jgi:hypothetical protein